MGKSHDLATIAADGLSTPTLKVDTIQNTSGTSALTINSSGLVIPKSIIFHAYANDIDQSISAATNTVIQFPTVIIDNGSGWDSTNHRYVPSVAGYYLCSATIRSSQQVVSKKVITWRKNGSGDSGIETRFQTNTDELTSSNLPAPTTLIQANGSGDYIDLVFNCEEAMTLSTSGIPAHSEINIMLIHAT